MTHNEMLRLVHGTLVGDEDAVEALCNLEVFSVERRVKDEESDELLLKVVDWNAVPKRLRSGETVRKLHKFVLTIRRVE